MSRTRKLIIAFWIFIGCMLAWQFYTYDQGVQRALIDHPQQQHFYFFPTNAPTAVPTSAPHNGAEVQQTEFLIRDSTPSAGNFTCQVTLKNLGNARAVGVQINVRPYRGVSSYNEDVGHQSVIVLSEDDPISQFGQWVSFPDLAPGESSTQSVSFISRPDVKPGTNPAPAILFKTEKAEPHKGIGD